MAKKPNTYILEIQLKHATIPVWRILEIDKKFTIHQLHLCIQVAMRWKCEHLYEFKINKNKFVFPDPNHPEDLGPGTGDSTKFKLAELGLEIGDTFTYLYDFGDGWEHDIVVKAFTQPMSWYNKPPRCPAGAMACPPEDLGGIFVYNQLVGFIINRTPITVFPDLQKIFKTYDPYNVDLVADYSFARIVNFYAKRYTR